MDCEMCGGNFGELCSRPRHVLSQYLYHEILRRDFHERKSVSRHIDIISPYLASHISSLLLLDTRSSSMSTPQNTEYMDARGATFNNVGRDHWQINADQFIINPN